VKIITVTISELIKMQCVECDNDISLGADSISCKQCKGQAHIECAKANTASRSSTRSVKKLQRFSWLCSRCLTDKDESTSLGEHSDGNSDKADEDSVSVKSLLFSMNQKYDSILKLVSDVPAIKNNVETLSKQNEEFKNNKINKTK
jgi:hypothetical protein